MGLVGPPLVGGGWGCRGVGFWEDDNVIHLGHQEKGWGGVKICPLREDCSPWGKLTMLGPAQLHILASQPSRKTCHIPSAVGGKNDDLLDFKNL